MGINAIVDWMQQTQDTIQWLAVLDTTVNLAVSLKVVNFFRVQDFCILKKNSVL